jgi:hypothetical protein
MDKHSSLFFLRASDEEKSFQRFSSKTNFEKLFSFAISLPGK